VALLLLGVKRRWALIGVGAVACAVVALVGGKLLLRREPVTTQVRIRKRFGEERAQTHFEIRILQYSRDDQPPGEMFWLSRNRLVGS